MTQPETVLDRIGIAVPCEARWEDMQGDDRVRFCGACKLNVYNLAGFRREEAEALIAGRGDRLCARLFQRPDGTVVTRECLTVAARLRRRIRWAVAAACALLGASGAAAAFARGGPGSDPLQRGSSFWSADPAPVQMVMGVMCVRPNPTPVVPQPSGPGSSGPGSD